MEENNQADLRIKWIAKVSPFSEVLQLVREPQRSKALQVLKVIKTGGQISYNWIYCQHADFSNPMGENFDYAAESKV
jgi:hypothetical protein